MGVKKIARPLNQAKNEFLKWLKKNKATDIDVFEGRDGTDEGKEWDYYIDVTAFVSETLYAVSFMMWSGTVKIDYSDEDNRYSGLTISQFLELIK